MIEQTERGARRLRLALRLAIISGVLWIALSFLMREIEIRRLQAELALLERQKAKVLQEIEELKVRLQSKDDLRLLEYLARKELGMVKPGEEVYLIVESDEEQSREP
ncbi:MAG: septum formation initiator family protein [Candidatus Bipolaricaulota bacterium]|nr:septum formation initiator family protein [Candidatus Bipolaricaulota bacterium]MCS7275298.1 septum formation initiator family protein [Candidatus Bipolaricaulota bacterium]MDW8111522.1 septum formation initiator family protein [Candidatus Bipolaricaulota bacterium]MDW8329410.1 septum formation initiator family protein [Candidatus Bipolaricaulota bacterium]